MQSNPTVIRIANLCAQLHTSPNQEDFEAPAKAPKVHKRWFANKFWDLDHTSTELSKHWVLMAFNQQQMWFNGIYWELTNKN